MIDVFQQLLTYFMKGGNKMNETQKENLANVLDCGSLDEFDSLFEEDLFNDFCSLVEDKLNEQAELIIHLQTQLQSAGSKIGRKDEVLALLKEHGTISILEIAHKLNISTKNVSSQLTYLRSDGYKIFTDHKGRKVLVE